MNKIPDLLGWNIYPGWYGGRKEDFGATLDGVIPAAHGGFLCQRIRRRGQRHTA